MKLALSPADKKLFEEIADPQLLSDRVPYIKTALEGIEEMSSMMSEISTRGRHTGIAGMDKDCTMQKVAHIPVHVASAMLLVEPDIFTDKKKFYAWLRSPAGRPWAYHRKVVKRA